MTQCCQCDGVTPPPPPTGACCYGTEGCPPSNCDSVISEGDCLVKPCSRFYRDKTCAQITCITTTPEPTTQPPVTTAPPTTQPPTTDPPDPELGCCLPGEDDVHTCVNLTRTQCEDLGGTALSETCEDAGSLACVKCCCPPTLSIPIRVKTDCEDCVMDETDTFNGVGLGGDLCSDPITYSDEGTFDCGDDWRATVVCQSQMPETAWLRWNYEGETCYGLKGFGHGDVGNCDEIIDGITFQLPAPCDDISDDCLCCNTTEPPDPECPECLDPDLRGDLGCALNPQPGCPNMGPCITISSEGQKLECCNDDGTKVEIFCNDPVGCCCCCPEFFSPCTPCQAAGGTDCEDDGDCPDNAGCGGVSCCKPDGTDGGIIEGLDNCCVSCPDGYTRQPPGGCPGGGGGPDPDPDPEPTPGGTTTTSPPGGTTTTSPPGPLGRCCYCGEYGLTCSMFTEAECDDKDGYWDGGQTCSAGCDDVAEMHGLVCTEGTGTGGGDDPPEDGPSCGSCYWVKKLVDGVWYWKLPTEEEFATAYGSGWETQWANICAGNTDWENDKPGWPMRHPDEPENNGCKCPCPDRIIDDSLVSDQPWVVDGGAFFPSAGRGEEDWPEGYCGKIAPDYITGSEWKQVGCGDGSCCRRHWSWPTTWSDGSPFGDEHKTEENYWLRIMGDWECEDNIKEADCLGYCNDSEKWNHGKDGCESKWSEDNHNCERYSPESNASTVDGWMPCNDCSCPSSFSVVAKLKVIGSDDNNTCGFEETSYTGDDVSLYPKATMTAESAARYLLDGGQNGTYYYVTSQQRFTCGGKKNPDGSDFDGDTWKYSFTCNSQKPKSSADRWMGWLETCQGKYSRLQAQNPDATNLCFKPPVWEFEVPVTKTDCPCCITCGQCTWEHDASGGGWTLLSSDCADGCECDDPPENTDPSHHAHAVIHTATKPCVQGGGGGGDGGDDDDDTGEAPDPGGGDDDDADTGGAPDPGGDDGGDEDTGDAPDSGGDDGGDEGDPGGGYS